MASPGELKVKNKRLFFVYAHPCGDILVRRGSMGEGTLKRVREKLRDGDDVDEDPKLFRVAYALISMLAREKKREEIDDEVIREYYLERHDEHVMKEAESRADVIPEVCRVFPARVVEVSGNKAVVETPVGRKSINIEFVPNVHAGDFLTVHYSYACEKISGEDFRKLWREKDGE